METYFYSLNDFLRKKHGQKVIKLSIDGGFTCPNRDGSKGKYGCIFCSSKGSGDFAISKQLPIDLQLNKAISLLSSKWSSSNKYIAYFQSYSNTYDTVDALKVRYEAALSYPGVVGLAIATRPDCFSPEILDYLAELNTRTHLWVELGLQSIHSSTLAFTNQGYSLDCFNEAVFELSKRNIEVVAHMIIGFPNETLEHHLQTTIHLSKLPLQGVKIHMLHILDDSPLGQSYTKNPFNLLTEDEYIHTIGEILKLLPRDFVIHRLTGDGDGNHLIAPMWTKNKRHVLNGIQKYLRENNIHQGQTQNMY